MSQTARHIAQLERQIALQATCVEHITDGVAFLDSSLADTIRRAHNIDFQLNQGVDRTLSNILQEMTSSTLGSPTPPPRSPSPPLRSLTPPQSAVTDEHLPGGCGGL